MRLEPDCACRHPREPVHSNRGKREVVGAPVGDELVEAGLEGCAWRLANYPARALDAGAECKRRAEYAPVPHKNVPRAQDLERSQAAQNVGSRVRVGHNVVDWHRMDIAGAGLALLENAPAELAPEAFDIGCDEPLTGEEMVACLYASLTIMGRWGAYPNTALCSRSPQARSPSQLRT